MRIRLKVFMCMYEHKGLGWNGTYSAFEFPHVGMWGLHIHIHLSSCVRICPSVYINIHPSILQKLPLPRVHKQLKISTKGCKTRTKTKPDNRNSELITGNKFHQECRAEQSQTRNS